MLIHAPHAYPCPACRLMPCMHISAPHAYPCPACRLNAPHADSCPACISPPHKARRGCIRMFTCCATHPPPPPQPQPHPHTAVPALPSLLLTAFPPPHCPAPPPSLRSPPIQPQALSASLLTLSALYVRRQLVINPNRVYLHAMMQLNTHPGVLEVGGRGQGGAGCTCTP